MFRHMVGMLASKPRLSVRAFGTVATDETFNQLVKSSKPVIVDCKADWCGPCRVLGPRLEKAVADTKGAVELVMVDVDDCPDTANQLGIQAMPTVFAFRNGKPVDQFMGLRDENFLRQWIAQLTQKPPSA